MCNLSQGVLVKGREQGWDEAIIHSAKSLIKKTGWPIDEVLSALEIPEAERDGIRKEIMAQ